MSVHVSMPVPVPVVSGGTGLTTGTSGGVPYFSSTSAIASSGALAQNGIVLGGGAGATPTTLATDASTTKVLVSGGTNTAPVWANISTATLPATAEFITSLGVNTTTPSDQISLTVKNSSNGNSAVTIQNSRNNADSEAINPVTIIKTTATATAGTNRFIRFQINAGATNSGYIASNGTDAAAFFSSSDKRKKKTIDPLVGGLDAVLALKPCTWKWKSDNSKGIGFVAQELAQVLPQCVHKTDNGTDTLADDGWAVTESGMMPYLVAAIQELKLKNDALEARIAALEAK